VPVAGQAVRIVFPIILGAFQAFTIPLNRPKDQEDQEFPILILILFFFVSCRLDIGNLVFLVVKSLNLLKYLVFLVIFGLLAFISIL